MRKTHPFLNPHPSLNLGSVNMTNVGSRLLLFLIAALGLFSGTARSAEALRPNVILIFIDDMGYGDVGFNGATVPKTPNLDQMATEGMKFTDFYVGCAVCSGSRTAAHRMSLPTSEHERRAVPQQRPRASSR